MLSLGDLNLNFSNGILRHVTNVYDVNMHDYS